MAPEVMDDIAELKRLLDQAKQPRVKELLSTEIARLQKGAAAIEPKPAPATMPLEKIPAAVPEIHYTPVSSFSWEQDDKSVKIYIGIEGVSSDKVTSKFEDESLDVKILDLSGKNYRYGVPKLHQPINPATSSVIVKPKRLVIVLKKRTVGRWSDLHCKDKFKPEEKKDKDPMAGVMDLMKNMYDEGDDNMKRTIAQAWTDARAKQGAL